MTSFKTKAGTELPLIKLGGKEYLQVAHRLVWFREERADWSIETKPLHFDGTGAVFQATIKDASGRIVATATKSETKQGFADYIEKAETGAVGRALAYCGYGTQFCGDELDEGARIADAPVSVRQAPAYQSAPRPAPKAVAPAIGDWSPVPESKPAPEPEPQREIGKVHDACGKPMMVSKYAERDGSTPWYCTSCRAKVPRIVA